MSFFGRWLPREQRCLDTSQLAWQWLVSMAAPGCQGRVSWVWQEQTQQRSAGQPEQLMSLLALSRQQGWTHTALPKSCSANWGISCASASGTTHKPLVRVPKASCFTFFPRSLRSGANMRLNWYFCRVTQLERWCTLYLSPSGFWKNILKPVPLSPVLVGNVGGKRGTNCGNKSFLPIFFLILVSTHSSPDRVWRDGEHGFATDALGDPVTAIAPLFAFSSHLWPVFPLGTAYTQHTAHSTTGTLLWLPITLSSNASNLFLRCLLFPSASDPAAHIAEFTRADGIPWEGSRAAF